MTDGLSNDKMQLKALWCEAFGDCPEDVDAFMDTLYSEGNVIKLSIEEKIVSAAYLVDVKLSQKCGRTLDGYYFCCAATKRKERGKGHMSEIIKRGKALSEERGKSFIALIPASNSLFEFYSRFGFRDFFYCEQTVISRMTGNKNNYSFVPAQGNCAGTLAQLQNAEAMQHENYILKSQQILEYTLLDAQISNYQIYFIEKQGQKVGYMIFDNSSIPLVREIILCQGNKEEALSQFLVYKNIESLTARLPNRRNGERKGMILPVDNCIFPHDKTAFINHLLEA